MWFVIRILNRYFQILKALLKIKRIFTKINVSTNFKDYIGNANDWDLIVKEAFS